MAQRIIAMRRSLRLINTTTAALNQCRLMTSSVTPTMMRRISQPSFRVTTATVDAASSSQYYESSSSSSSNSSIPLIPGRSLLHHHHHHHHHMYHHQRNFSIRATVPLQDESKTTTPTTSNNKDDDPKDEVPPWQNPTLHKPNASPKIMLSDYENTDTPPPMVPLPPVDIHNDGKVLAAPHLHSIAEEITQLNMMEVKELVDRVAEHFGIEEDDTPHPDGGGGGGDADGGGGAEAEEVVEKTTFDLKLTGYDAKSKIKVIKEVRAITALGLKEAKALVEGAPKVVKGGIKMEEAEELKVKLEGIGAIVEIV